MFRMHSSYYMQPPLFAGYLSHQPLRKSWGGMWKSILSHSKCKLPKWFRAGVPIDMMIIIINICNGCSYTLIATANIPNVLQDGLQLYIPDYSTRSIQFQSWSQSQWNIENDHSYQRRRYATVILTLTFLLPLNFINLRKVSWVSVLGIIASGLLVVVVACCGPGINSSESPVEIWNPTARTIGCFAQFSIAVCAHSISPNFYQALERKSPSRFAETTALGYVIILIFNLIVATFGCLRFGDKIQDQANILEAYSNGGLIVNVARV